MHPKSGDQTPSGLGTTPQPAGWQAPGRSSSIISCSLNTLKRAPEAVSRFSISACEKLGPRNDPDIPSAPVVLRGWPLNDVNGGERCTDRPAGIARRRLNPDVFECAIAQHLAVRHTIECHAAREAQIFCTSCSWRGCGSGGAPPRPGQPGWRPRYPYGNCVRGFSGVRTGSPKQCGEAVDWSLPGQCNNRSMIC